MAGVTKEEGRIPPLLPQTSSSSSLSHSLSPSLPFPLSLSSLSLLLPPSPSMVSPSPTCSSHCLGRSRAGRHRVVGTPDILSLLSSSLYPTPGSPFLSPTRSPIRDGSPALIPSLTLIALASAEWEKSQPPPKLRLRPGHARHPPSPLRLSLPLFLLPLSPRSTHLTLSPRPFFPTWVVVVAIEQHYHLAQAVVIACRRCCHPFPSSPLLPSLPSLSLLRLDRRRAPAPLSYRCLGHGRSVRDRNPAQATATPPPSAAPLLLLLG